MSQNNLLLRDVPWAGPGAARSGLLVILGILGDLSRKKICDSNLGAFTRKPSALPSRFGVLGVDIKSPEEALGGYLGTVAQKLYAKTGSQEGVSYCPLDLVNGDYQPLFDLVNGSGARHVTILTAISPKLFPVVIPRLGAGLGKGLVQEGPVRSAELGARYGRGLTADLILEKPLGRSLTEASSILDLADEWFPRQNFMMDHYAGYEAIQNLITWLRFELTSAMWHSGNVESIVIEVTEAIGIEGRVEYYDAHGAALDFLVNHLLLTAVMALMNHEDPDSEAAMLEVLNAFQFDLSTLVTGQYAGYKDEVKADSKTETFVAVQGHVDTDRWRDTPVTLIHGKGGDTRRAEIRIKFRNGKTRVIDLDRRTLVAPTPYERMLTGAYARDFRAFPTGDVVKGQFIALGPVLDTIARTEPVTYLRGNRSPQAALELLG